jgi:hypothetical protein
MELYDLRDQESGDATIEPRDQHEMNFRHYENVQISAEAE